MDPHIEVSGASVGTAEVRPRGGGASRSIPWDNLDRTPLDPGSYDVLVRMNASGGESVEIPVCAGRKSVRLDGKEIAVPLGPVIVAVVPGPHDVGIEVEVSPYERRIACGERPRVGTTSRTLEGLGVLAFASPAGPRGGGRALLYVPPGHDLRRPAPVLVGLHPWNGTMWTYAAYAELLGESRAHDVLLLMPSGLGNSLYVADAESEVVRAIDALAEVVAVDPRRVSLWGASMGGAGATTIGFHRPDRFASITSFFGDSRYDLRSYVHAILPDERASHRVNALDVVENALNLPVWLIHGLDDHTSPVRQSEILADAMRERGMHVRFDRVPDEGHSGALVARFLPDVVARAAAAVVPGDVTRVTYRSVREEDLEAYGVRIVRASAHGDALVDVERRDDGVHVHRADGVREIWLARGAFGTPTERPPPVLVDIAAAAARAAWDPAP